MNIGDPIPNRCPRCGGIDMLLFEELTVYNTVEVASGRLVDRTDPGVPQPTGRWSGECQRQRCGHRWRLRRSPLQAAKDSPL
ncbi:hypothetical protein D9M68_822440 [compost metagenome]